MMPEFALSTEISERARVDGIYPFPTVMQTRMIENQTVHRSMCGRRSWAGPWSCCTASARRANMWGHLASALIDDHTIIAARPAMGRASRRSLMAL